MKRILVLCLGAGLLLQAASAAPHRQNPPAPPDHGGRIETKYDGFRRETVVALRPMPVTCGGAKGAARVTKGVCVNLSASLYCPGQQLDYVRHATLQLTFETKDWDQRHPPERRALSAVADGETIPLGTMRLVKQEAGEGWFDNRMKEVLEVTIPYAVFEKLARAQFVELSVGGTAFGLREKNVAALRDLSSRVRLAGQDKK